MSAMTVSRYEDSNTQQRNIAIAVVVLYIGLVLLVMFLVRVFFEKPDPPIEAAGGIEMDFGTSDDGMGDVQPMAAMMATISGGRKSSDGASYLSSESGDDVVSSSTNPDKQTTNSNNNNSSQESNNPATNYLGYLSDIINNSKGQGNTGKPGDQGSPDGIPGGTGTGGSGGGLATVGEGAATYKPYPTIDDIEQPSKVKVKLLIDKTGKVTEAVLIDGGAASASARKTCLSTAEKWKFPADDQHPVRVCYLTFKLSPKS